MLKPVHTLFVMIAFSLLTACFDKTSFEAPATEIGQTSGPVEIVIHNPAPEAVTISSIKFSRSTFSIADSIPFTLKKNERRKLKVYFNPTKTGKDTSLILVTAKKVGYDIPVQIASISGQGKKASPKAPQLKLSVSELDFGTLRAGESKSLPVVLKNEGESPLTISSLPMKGSPEFRMTNVRFPQTLKAGQSLNLSIVFTPKSIGSFQANFEVNSNDKESPNSIVAKGKVGAAALNLSTSRIDFAPIVLGQSLMASQPITLTNSGSIDLVVTQTQFISGANAFAVDLTLPLTLTPGQSTIAHVSFAPEAARELLYTSTLRFVSNAQSSPTLTLAGEAIGAQLLVSPSALDFGDRAVHSEMIEKTFKISNPGKADLILRGALVSDDVWNEIEITPADGTTIPAGGLALLIARFTPKANGTKAFGITFDSNAYLSSSLTLNAQVVSPQISLSANAFDFGTLKPNESKSLLLTLSNPGSVPLSIRSIILKGSGSEDFSYSLAGSPRVEAGASRSLTIEFEPKSEGDFDASLQIDSDAALGIIPVNLTGKAVAPASIAGPDFVTFGKTYLGESLRKRIQFKNAGPGRLHSLSPQLSGPAAGDFTLIQSPTGSIEAGDTVEVVVEYRGSEAARQAAVLTLASNASNGDIQVRLDAESVAWPALPEDPKLSAPALLLHHSFDFRAANLFLAEGDNPLQKQADLSRITSQSAGLIEGRILDAQAQPLAGARVSILQHSEYGYTLSREDGRYTLLVNAGSRLTVSVQRPGYLPVHRQIETTAGQTSTVPEIVLSTESELVAPLDWGGQVSTMQVFVGETIDDQDGSRTPRLFVPASTKATMILADGSRQDLARASLSFSEYSQGANGLRAMPATLPSTAAYGYAAGFSIAEAKAIDARAVEFSSPILLYLDGFIPMPTGSALPIGSYDYARAHWLPRDDGQVIEILSIQNGVALVDVDGDGSADSSSALNLSPAELQMLAQNYPEASNKKLWRTPLLAVGTFSLSPLGHVARDASPARSALVIDPRDSTRCESKSCIHPIESQALAQVLPIQGTPFSLNYSTLKSSGRTKDYTLSLNLSPASLSPELTAIHLRVRIAGQVFQKSFEPLSSLKFDFTWDGRDAFGRQVNGRQIAEIEIDSVYRSDYAVLNVENSRSFGKVGRSAESTFLEAIPARRDTTRVLSSRWSHVLGTPFDPSQGDSWGLDKRHHFEDKTSTLITGDGNRFPMRDIELKSMAQLVDARHLATDLSGNIYWVEGSPTHRIVKRSALGSQLSLSATPLAAITGLSFSETRNSLLVAGDRGIYELAPSGGLHHLAGNGGSECPTEFSGPATELSLGETSDVQINSQGEILFLACSQTVVLRLTHNGEIERVSGDPSGAISVAPNAPASDVRFGSAVRMLVGPNDKVYILSRNSSALYAIDYNGLIQIVSGTGTPGYSNDGGLARNAQLDSPESFAIDKNGQIWIADQRGTKLRVIDADGLISTRNLPEARGPSPQLLSDLAITADDQVLMFNQHAELVQVSVSGVQKNEDGTRLVMGKKGKVAYRFDADGRHLATLSTLHGHDILRFHYDENGLLRAIEDRDGLQTELMRSSEGLLSSIVSPYGETTRIEHDGNQRVSSIIDPADRVVRFEYTDDGLMNSFTNARGNSSYYAYDRLGLLTSEEDALGHATTLTRATDLRSSEIVLTTALGRQYAYQSLTNEDGSRTTRKVNPAGQSLSVTEKASFERKVEDSTGMSTSSILKDDARFGFAAAFPVSVETKTPSGIRSRSQWNRTVTLQDEADFMSLSSIEDTTVLRGLGQSTKVFEKATRTQTSQSPSGYVSREIYNAKGRLTRLERAGLQPIDILYNTEGRVSLLTQGDRSSAFAYNSLGRLASKVNALSQTNAFAYDAAGRLSQMQKADGRLIRYAYDSTDNLTSVTVPKNQSYGFQFDALDQITLNTDPLVPGAFSNWSYVYNADRQIERADLPNGEHFQYSYDEFGRLDHIGGSRGDLSYTYEEDTGRLASSLTTGGNRLDFDWDGNLLNSVRWTGQITGSYTRFYGEHMRVSAELVNGLVEIPYTYTPEGSPKSVGPLSLSYNAANGLLLESSMLSSKESLSYNEFGEPLSRSFTLGSQTLLAETMTRDALGRIASLTRSVNGVSESFTYGYDASGRLIQSAKSGGPTEIYAYDPNDNRLFDSALYDSQDRMVRNSEWNFTYNARGHLASKSSRLNTQVFSYNYDNLGQLLAVTGNNGLTLSYAYDAQGRQIARLKNGVMTRGLIYRDQLRPVAELNPDGSQRSVFVYGSRRHVPEFMERGGVLYRFVTDHLGSVRLVVNLASRQVVQTISYDNWGRVLSDSNPGFQPFGFAGGLYDHETGLLRFGARDYDARINRWLDKNPSRSGLGSNDYAYAGSDPLNAVDVSGRGSRSSLSMLVGHIESVDQRLGDRREFADLFNQKEEDIFSPAFPENRNP